MPQRSMLKDYGTAAHGSLIFAHLPPKSFFTLGLLSARSQISLSKWTHRAAPQIHNIFVSAGFYIGTLLQRLKT